MSRISTREAGQILGFATETVRRWCASGRFKTASKTLGTHCWRIDRAEVEGMIGSCQSPDRIVISQAIIDSAIQRRRG